MGSDSPKWEVLRNFGLDIPPGTAMSLASLVTLSTTSLGQALARAIQDTIDRQTEAAIERALFRQVEAFLYPNERLIECFGFERPDLHINGRPYRIGPNAPLRRAPFSERER